MLSIDERIKNIDKFIENLHTDFKALEFQKTLLASNVDKKELEVENLLNEIATLEKSIATFKEIADTRSEDAKKHIEDTLNWALNQIPLKQRYSAVLVESNSKKSTKEIYIQLVDLDTGKKREIKTQTGTAIAQIVSFFMNVILIMVSGSSRIMLLDEVFSGIQDVESIRVFGDILVSIAEKEKFQFIFIEHKSTLLEVEGIKPIYLDLQNYDEGAIIVNDISEIISPVSNANYYLTEDDSGTEIVSEVDDLDTHTIAVAERQIKNEVIDDDEFIDLSEFD